MPSGGVDRVRDSLARTCVPEKRKILTWLVTGIDLQILYVDVPCLNVGIESTNSRSQTCPGRIQESNLELQTVAYRRALAGYRNRVWYCSRQQIHPGKIQKSDLRTLQTCPVKIQESSLVH